MQLNFKNTVMKKLYYFSICLLLSCAVNSDAQESLIIDYLETSASDLKTDLKLDVLELELSNITVNDSTAILENRFRERMEKEEETIEGFQTAITSALQKKDSLDRSNIDNLDKISANKSLIKLYKNGLEKAQQSLKKAQTQKTKALEKYENLDENEVLVKEAITTFSYLNPKLNVRQERTETFVLSKDGSEVLGLIYKGKIRSKH